ncbi:hypothetical protein CDAR_384981 [Caerostris darwini]|uniref:Uncharacterized protein n=1 Tax=Caerostris darwini TaxID=1538125 RepID=A0AAV4WDB4_9ARAC|nr:hypothetical protein CDAR_384981 [Caerostris darwini]
MVVLKTLRSLFNNKKKNTSKPKILHSNHIPSLENDFRLEDLSKGQIRNPTPDSILPLECVMGTLSKCIKYLLSAHYNPFLALFAPRGGIITAISPPPPRGIPQKSRNKCSAING